MAGVTIDRAQPRNMQVRIASGLTILAGLWMIASPWFLGTNGRSAAAGNDVIVGFIVVLLAAARFAGVSTLWQAWWIIPLGAWTIISPWVYGFATASPPLEHDSLVLGIALVALSAWSALATLAEETSRHLKA